MLAIWESNSRIDVLKLAIKLTNVSESPRITKIAQIPLPGPAPNIFVQYDFLSKAGSKTYSARGPAIAKANGTDTERKLLLTASTFPCISFSMFALRVLQT